MIKKEKTTDNILTLAKKLIAIPSTADNIEGLHNVLAIAKKELQGYFAMEEFESNGVPSLLVHNTNERTKHFKIILNAHLDVVPGKTEQFHAYEEKGKLYGRGAYDMKAAAAVMIVLFKDIAKEIDYPLALQLVTDEEMISEHTTQYQINKGVRGEFIICGECSSNFNIKNQAKGALWIEVIAQGKTAHGGYPWRGDNAIWKLVKTLEQMHDMFPTPTEEAWVTTMNLASISTTNMAANAVPDNARAEIDIRYIPEETDTILDKVKALMPSDIMLTVLQKTVPTYVSPDNYFVVNLKNSVEKIIGKEATIQSTHATSDIRFYNEVDCLGVEFGPIGGDQHGDNEWVDIKSLEEYYYILKNFLLTVQ